MKKNQILTIYSCITIFFLILIEIICAKLAFHTLGEISSHMYFFVIALNSIPIIFILKKKQEQLATATLCIIALLIIPYQLYLGNLLLSLKEEAANITAYVYEEGLDTGEYPKDLAGYIFSTEKLKNHFRYYIVQSHHASNERDGFYLDYFVGTKNTSHYYQSANRQWRYYPD